MKDKIQKIKDLIFDGTENEYETVLEVLRLIATDSINDDIREYQGKGSAREFIYDAIKCAGDAEFKHHGSCEYFELLEKKEYDSLLKNSEILIKIGNLTKEAKK